MPPKVFDLVQHLVRREKLRSPSCSPPVVNSAAVVMVTPANDGQGVGTIWCDYCTNPHADCIGIFKANL